MQLKNKIDFSEREHSFADDLFVKRWSPRDFIKYDLKKETLKKIIDAARWSPSCVNEQPWRIFTALNESSNFKKFVNLLTEGNQTWAKNASVIGFIITKINFTKKNKKNRLSEFDCGAAWMSLSLQARIEGLYTHGMGGILRDEIEKHLDLNSDNYKVVMGFAIGKLDVEKHILSNSRIQNRPSSRLGLKDIWKEMD